MIWLLMEKKLYNQAVSLDIKRFEEIRKLALGKDEDSTTGCLLDYEYVKKINSSWFK